MSPATSILHLATILPPDNIAPVSCKKTLLTKVHVNTKNRLLSVQLRCTASSSQTERRDEGRNVFCFFFPTGFATSLQLVLCPLVLPPLSGLSLLCA